MNTRTRLFEALCARIYTGSNEEAAHYLGIPIDTLKGRLRRLRLVYGTESTTKLAVRLYPWLGEFYAIRHVAT